MNERPRRRQPIRGIGVKAANEVRRAIGYEHPTEMEIEVLAYMRGALVRSVPARGARANLLRVGERGVIGVGDRLSPEERRWAIAHELGHFEAHAGVSFLGLCSSRDMVSAYETSGREPEANAFAAELLMPQDLFAKRCDVARVTWDPIRGLANEFQVSVTAAALRFVTFTADRVALVCMKDAVIQWCSATRDFGERPARGARVPAWSEAHAYFAGREASTKPETVSASAWCDDADDDEDMCEHLLPSPHLGSALSLLWRKT